MRVLVVLLPCAACNSLLGLGPTTEEPIDAPPVPFACSPLPAFTMLHTAVSGCTDYTTDSHAVTRAVAMCGSQVSQGPPDATSLTPVMFSDSRPHDKPRLAPSGELMVLRSLTPANMSHPIGFYFYARSPDDRWSQLAEIMLTNAVASPDRSDFVGTPTGGMVGVHIVWQRYDASAHKHEFRELQEGASLSTWEPETITKPEQFMLDDITDPYLSENGLGLMFVGTIGGAKHIYIATRLFIKDPFTNPVEVTVPGVDLNAPFLTADCAQLFLSSMTDTLVAGR